MEIKKIFSGILYFALLLGIVGLGVGFLVNTPNETERDSCLDEILGFKTKCQTSITFSESKQNGSIYHDEKYGYANVAMRAVGQITRDLYDRISMYHIIDKFGVAISKKEDLNGDIKSLLYRNEKISYLETPLSDVLKDNDSSSELINWYGSIINIEDNESSITEKYVAISYVVVDDKYEFCESREFSVVDVSSIYLESAKATDRSYNTWKYLASFAE